MARFVLLHSPLLTAASWAPTAERLRDLGHEAEVPSWLSLGRVGAGFYQALTSGLAVQLEDPASAILVPHSAAGSLIPALAEHLAQAPAGVIFTDAILPHPGASWLQNAPSGLAAQLRDGAVAGRLPSWDQWWPPGALERLVPDNGLRGAVTADLEPIPIAYFEEPAPKHVLRIPGAYLKLSSSYEDEAVAAGRLGWPVIRLLLDHLAIATQPQAVATALVSLSEAILG